MLTGFAVSLPNYIDDFPIRHFIVSLGWEFE